CVSRRRLLALAARPPWWGCCLGSLGLVDARCRSLLDHRGGGAASGRWVSSTLAGARCSTTVVGVLPRVAGSRRRSLALAARPPWWGCCLGSLGLDDARWRSLLDHRGGGAAEGRQGAATLASVVCPTTEAEAGLRRRACP